MAKTDIATTENLKLRRKAPLATLTNLHAAAT